MQVRIEMPGRKLRRDVTGATLARALRSAATGAAYWLASSVKARVSIYGKHHQGSFAYSTSGRQKQFVRFGEKVERVTVHPVSPRYPVSGGRVGKNGARIFASSAHFHKAAGARPGTFNVNKRGGMWSGLSVRVFSRNAARIEFRGRSEGQGMLSGRALRSGQKTSEPHFRRMKTGVKARPRKVSNALKAATVRANTGIHVLAVTHAELVKLTNMVAKHAASRSGLRIPQKDFVDLMVRAQLGPGRVK